MFKYLGSNVTAKGDVVDEVIYRINEGQKVLGAVNRVFKSRNVRLNVKKMCVRKSDCADCVVWSRNVGFERE